jgi:hypothetical protein
MFSLPIAGRGPIRSLPSKRWLSTAAAATAVPNRHLIHDVSKSKTTGAGTQAETSTYYTSPRPQCQGQSAAFKNIESIRHQLQGNVHNSDLYQTVAPIMKIREQYIQDRAVFVRGQDMLPILLGLGASYEDISTLPSTSDKLESDPTIPFRTTRNSRFCFDFDTKSMRRLEHQAFMLSEDEDFKRYDSGRVRNFDEVGGDIGLNSAFLALLVFKAIMINGIDIARRPNLNYDLNKWVCTAFSVRTHTTPDLVGEPALEGVHSDGADHTLVTFLGANNMTSNSAATFLHSMDEITGTPLRESSPLKILGHNRHGTFLDTMMIIDHERKHSLTAVNAEDETKKATRDVLIFFTRKPYLETHSAASLDSLKPHTSLGVELPLLDLS